MGRIHIRPLEKKDLKYVMDIEEASFQDPWNEVMFYNELENRKTSIFYVVLLDGRLVGYVGMWIIQDEGHILNLAVHPDYRRQGIGSILLETIFKKAREKGVRQFTLEVRASNTIAQQFYKKFGLKEIAIRKGYYNNQEDAIIMGLNVKELECV